MPQYIDWDSNHFSSGTIDSFLAVLVRNKVNSEYCSAQTANKSVSTTVSPHIRLAGIIISHSLQMWVLLENTTFSLHKIVRNAGIIRIAGIILI